MSTIDIIWIGAITASFLLFALTLYQSRKLIERWAADNGFELLETHFEWLYRGPFFLRSTKAQTVYRFIVRDLATGEIKSGWARCGNWLWGVLGSDAIKVIFDKDRALVSFYMGRNTVKQLP